MDVTYCIYDAITVEVEQTHGVNAWLSQKYIIKDILAKLKPTMPEDGTHGFIAYDVPSDNPYGDRRKMKTGRFLTRKLNLNSGFLNDVSLRRIADSINSIMNPDCNYRLDSGDNIYKNYRDRIGGTSCMSGGDADKVGMYVDNPGVYQQAILQYGKDSARAMVIKLDNGMVLMDRIYSTCSFLIGKMREIAAKNQWFLRDSTDAGNYDICDCNGIAVKDYTDFVVSDLKYTDGEVPYQDTLTHYKLSGSRISLTHNSCSSYYGTLDSTDGYIENNQDNCYNCGDSYHIDNLMHSDVTGEHYCDYCWNRIFSLCDRCEEYCLSEDGSHIEDNDAYWCDSCVENYAMRCSNCGELNCEDYEIVEDNVYCNSCVDDKCKTCEDCGEVFLGENINENGLCEDCEPVEIYGDVKALVYPGQTNIPEIQ